MLLHVYLCSFQYTCPAQLISDNHISKDYTCSSCNLKGTTNNDFKIVRVNIHFITRSDGSDNFNETSNINGDTSSENGYWLADRIINSH